MRYPRGSIQLNQSRDFPLLRQILRSEYVTHSQLFEFSRLNHFETSRNAFQWRMRRLVDRGLVVRQRLATVMGDAVYSVAGTAATLLQSMGEYCLIGCGRADSSSAGGHAIHALGLNEIQLAALRAGVLVRWMSTTEIRSRNELTQFGFAKDYDAIVTVRADERERKFALEYERSPKSAKCYRAIAASVSQEIHVNLLLYLVSNFDILKFVSGFFSGADFPVFFGLMADWQSRLLDMPVLGRQGKSVSGLLHALNSGAENAGPTPTPSSYPLPFH